MNFKSVMSVTSIVCLVGCSSYKENFDCPVGTGMGCASLSRVNKAMDKGRIQIEEPDYEDDHTKPSKEIVITPKVVWGSSFISVR